MAQPKPPKKPEDKIEVESGFEKRLGEMYKKVLHTPPKHVPDKRTKANKDK
jgi:hypothetical protein